MSHITDEKKKKPRLFIFGAALVLLDRMFPVLWCKRVRMHHLRCNQNMSNCPPLIYSEVRRGRSRQEVCAVNDSAGSENRKHPPVSRKRYPSTHTHTHTPRILPHAKGIKVMLHIVLQLPVMQTNNCVFQISFFLLKGPLNPQVIACILRVVCLGYVPCIWHR